MAAAGATGTDPGTGTWGCPAIIGGTTGGIAVMAGAAAADAMAYSLAWTSASRRESSPSSAANPANWSPGAPLPLMRTAWSRDHRAHQRTRGSVPRMEFRRLGRSGLMVSEISYGNWITHGSQVEEEQAKACVNAALDAGITTFDTADVYAGTRAEAVLGRALAGQRREGLEIFTKVYWPTGPGRNDRGLSRKHIMESCHGSLRRLQTDYVDLYQAHRFDDTVPLEETMLALSDLVRAGKVLYVGVSEWTGEQITRGAELAAQLQVPFISSQPQYSMLWRVIEAEVIPASDRAGLGQIVWSPIAQGVLTGKYKPGQQPPSGSRATDATGGNFISRWLRDDVLTAVAELEPIAKECGLSMAQLAVAWVLQNPNVASAIVGATRPEQVIDNVGAAGVRLSSDTLDAIDTALAGVVVTDPSLTG